MTETSYVQIKNGYIYVANSMQQLTPHSDRNGSCVEKDGYRPLSRRMYRCDRVIQIESRDPFAGNVYYVTMQITFLTRKCKFRNVECNLHWDVVHIATKCVSSLTLDCNGVFAIKAYTKVRLQAVTPSTI